MRSLKALIDSFLRPAQSEQELRVPSIAFAGEQVGPFEEMLKARLRPVLARSVTERAYLALADVHDGLGVRPTLCLRHLTSEDSALLAELGEEFRQLASSAMSLDIVYVGPDQESVLSRVCRPFYG